MSNFKPRDDGLNAARGFIWSLPLWALILWAVL